MLPASMPRAGGLTCLLSVHDLFCFVCVTCMFISMSAPINSAAADVAAASSTPVPSQRFDASPPLLTKRKRNTEASGDHSASVLNEPHATGSKAVTNDSTQAGSAHKKAKQMTAAAGTSITHAAAASITSAAAAVAQSQHEGDGAAAMDKHGNIYKIARILARKGRGRSTKYLIAWNNTWVSVRDLVNAKEALRDFEEGRDLEDNAAAAQGRHEDASSNEFNDDEDDDEGIIYEFTHIMEREGRGRNTKYLLAWADSWVAVQDLVNAEEALRNFGDGRRGEDLAVYE